MQNEVKLSINIDKSDPAIAILYNNEYRYSQAKTYGDTLRYYKAGVTFEHIGGNEIEISFSIKLGSKGDRIRIDGRRCCVPFKAIIKSLSFKDNIYTEFNGKIGFDLFAIHTCLLDKTTGEISINGTMDPKLDTQTFAIGYPLGQPTLVNA